MSYKLSHKVNLPPVDDKIVRTIALITNHKTGLYWASDAYLAKQAMCTVSLAKQVRRYCERIGVLKPTGKIYKCSDGFGGTKEYIFDPEPIKLYSVWSRIRLDRPDHSGKRYGDGGPVAARTLPAGSREE